MALTTYTTYDSIRAILGTSAKELKDAVLALPLFEQQFLLEMGDVDGGVGAVMTQYATIAAITGSKTADQQRLFDLVGMLAGYSVARQLLTGGPLAFPQEITDGKASLKRFDTDNFTKVREGVIEMYAALMRRLGAVLAKLDPTAVVFTPPSRTFILASGIASDPVTGT